MLAIGVEATVSARHALSSDAKRRGAADGRGELPLRQAAYERIEALLSDGILRPGQLITQRQLVEKTGATLASVREAVPRFEAEGLLVTVPQRGLMVPSLDVTFVREAYQLRRVLELAAVPDMIQRMDRRAIEDWIAWHRSVRRQLVEPSAGEQGALAGEIQRRDWDMHQDLVESMGNSLIANVYRVTAIKIRMAVQSRIQVKPDNALRVVDEHLAILLSIYDRDARRTLEAMELHLSNSLKLALGEEV